MDAVRTDKPRRLLRLPDVRDKLKLGRTAIYALVKRGELPQPVKLGTASAWPEHEIDAYIERLMSERPASPPTPPSS